MLHEKLNTKLKKQTSPPMSEEIREAWANWHEAEIALMRIALKEDEYINLYDRTPSISDVEEERAEKDQNEMLARLLGSRAKNAIDICAKLDIWLSQTVPDGGHMDSFTPTEQLLIQAIKELMTELGFKTYYKIQN